MRTTVPTGFRRSVARHGGRTLCAVLVAALLVPLGAAPAGAGIETSSTGPGSSTPEVDLARFGPEPGAASTAGLGDAPDTAPDSAGLQPSVQYEEAVRHAEDRIDFTPGERVTIGFTPRPGDAWDVGGRAPTALPAGRLDGATIRGQGRERTTPRNPAGPSVAAALADPTVDLPSDAGAGVPATNASLVRPSDPPAPAPEARVDINGLRKEIFGFLPYWEINSSTLRLDYSKISTIAYFGVGADGAGNLQKRNSDGSLTVGWSGWTSSRMTSIISAAHSTHTRVVLTVQSFGWSTAGLSRQKSLLSTSTRRLNLAKQIAAAVRDRGADGVNLDFEPLASGYEAQFTALVKVVRSELNKIHAGYQITFDTLGSIGNYPIEDATAAGAADAIFVMGYDYRTAGSSPVGSIAPYDRTGYGIRDTVLAYTARVPSSKVILGVPYYGRAWSTSSDLVHATNVSGTKYGASTTVVYDTAANYLATYGRRWEATERVAWTAYRRQNCTSTYGCVTSWRQIYVDDAAAISAKYDLVNTYGLRGAGIWALGYDGTRTDLYGAIQRKFVTDTTPPVAGIINLAARQVNPVFPVTWAGRDDVMVKNYDIQVSGDGGTWGNWLLATTATSAAWPGFDNHVYAFRVRARDLKGNVSAWNVATTSVVASSSLVPGAFARVLVDGLNTRTAAGLDATKVGTFDTGTLVAIVGGPVALDGYTWLRVTGPLTEWGPVRPTTTVWVAADGGRLGPAPAPNVTKVGAALGDLSFDSAGAASVGSTSAAAGHRAFSPNADNSRDRLAIAWTADRDLTTLSLRVFGSGGALIGSVPLSELTAGPHEIQWDGRVGGALLADGRYLASLVGTTASGSLANPGLTFRSTALALYGVTIDRVAPVVTGASASGSLISPNGDGRLDSVAVALTTSGASAWSFAAAPVSGSTLGAAVTTGGGTGGAGRVTWTGRTNAGAVVADGLYRLTLTARDPAGNRVSRSWNVRVDTTPATLGSTVTPGSFSPDGDGQADTTRYAWTASERITGTARVLRGTTTIRSWALTAGTSGALTWNGTDASGVRVADGTYAIQIVARDAAGNRSSRSVAVKVDRTIGDLQWSRAAFYPQDGDALLPTSRVGFAIRRSATVSVGIYQGATLVRTIWTNHASAAGQFGWTWNGRNDSGELVPRGVYEVRVTARSWVGSSSLRRSVLVDAFKVAYSGRTLQAGQTLTLTLTTTEALKASPTVSLTQPGLSALTRTATALGSGVYRVSFTVAAGAPGTAAIRITGRDTGGGLNVSLGSITIQ